MPNPQLFPHTWLLPDAIKNRMGRTAGPQRAIYEEGHLLLIFHQIPSPTDNQRKPAFFWRQPGGEWRSSLGGVGLADLQNLLESYEKKLHQLEELENRAKGATDYHSVLENVAPVYRASRGLFRTLQQGRDFEKEDLHLINFRDDAAGIEREAELLFQDAQFGLNFTQAKQAETQAVAAQKMERTSHRLNLMAAIFFPLTALASLFGMEIHSGLADTPIMFVAICAFGVMMGICVGLFLGRD